MFCLINWKHNLNPLQSLSHSYIVCWSSTQSSLVTTDSFNFSFIIPNIEHCMRSLLKNILQQFGKCCWSRGENLQVRRRWYEQSHYHWSLVSISWVSTPAQHSLTQAPLELAMSRSSSDQWAVPWPESPVCTMTSTTPPTPAPLTPALCQWLAGVVTPGLTPLLSLVRITLLQNNLCPTVVSLRPWTIGVIGAGRPNVRTSQWSLTDPVLGQSTESQK